MTTQLLALLTRIEHEPVDGAVQAIGEMRAQLAALEQRDTQIRIRLAAVQGCPGAMCAHCIGELREAVELLEEGAGS